MYAALLFVCVGSYEYVLIPTFVNAVHYDLSEESLPWTLQSFQSLLFGLTRGHRRILRVSLCEYLFVLPFLLAETSTWAMPPLNRKQPLAKRAAISQPVKTGHILFCVGLTLSSPKLCSPLVTSQAWWNLYWCCLKGLELIHCFFLTAQFWIRPRCHRTGCPAEAELSWAVDMIHTVAICVSLLKCCFHPELSSQH